MKSFEQFIAEGRDAPIYHTSTLSDAAKIIKTNVLKMGNNGSISFTREIRHAEWFNDVIFVLNQAKLAQNYKLIPIWDKKPELIGQPKTPMHMWKGSNEFEERIHGRDITDFDKYIVSILVKEKQMNKASQTLMSHPKVVVYRGNIHPSMGQ